MRTVTDTSRPEPSTFVPRKPASSAAKTADSSARTASAYSARTAMIASRAPTARAAIAMPSTTANGRVSMSRRLVPWPGSAS